MLLKLARSRLNVVPGEPPSSEYATKSCGEKGLVKRVFSMVGLAAANLDILNSFEEGTLVLTRHGYQPIETILVGDEVAAIDEKTGARVWRKVIERFTRRAPGTLHITVQDSDGKRDTIVATSEHPFHVENWDKQSAQDLFASLSGETSLPDHVLLPSEQSTNYGDWVRAGALKAGDKISTLTSVGAGPTVAKAEVLKRANGNSKANIADSESWTPEAETAADDTGQSRGSERLITDSQLADADIPAANDNRPLTVLDILHDSGPTRVYNFEVESLYGEITHNYLVGLEQAWVHNGRGAAWRKIYNDPNTPSFIRGWIKNKLRHGRKFWNMLNPPGCDLGHPPDAPARDGNPHGPRSRIEWTRDNRGRGGRFGR